MDEEVELRKYAAAFLGSVLFNSRGKSANISLVMIFRTLRRLAELRPGDRLHHEPSSDGAPPFDDDDLPWQSNALGRLAPKRCSLITLTPTQHFVDWARKQPGCRLITLASARAHGTVSFIMPLEAGEAFAGQFLREHCSRFFAQMLDGVVTDSSRWPADRSWPVFHEWFSIEHLGTVVDIADAIRPPGKFRVLREDCTRLVASIRRELRRWIGLSSGRGPKQAWARTRRDRALIHLQNRGFRRTCTQRSSSF